MPRVGRRFNHIKLFGKRHGFSLLLVLIISVLGMTMIAAAMQITVLSSGSGRVVSAGNEKYNTLQSAVQEGMAALHKAMVDNTDDGPIRCDGDTIETVDCLLVAHDFGAGLELGIVCDRPLSGSDLGKLRIAGNSGTLRVAVYDMQYDPQKISPTLSGTPALLNMLPPSLILEGGSGWGGRSVTTEAPDVDPNAHRTASSNDGVYLVRATLNVSGRTWILDSAIIQSTNYEI